MEFKIEKLVNLARNNTNIYEHIVKSWEILCKNPDYLSQNVGMNMELISENQALVKTIQELEFQIKHLDGNVHRLYEGNSILHQRCDELKTKNAHIICLSILLAGLLFLSLFWRLKS